MAPVLTCIVAAMALTADPGLKGLPFGVPPSPDDAVIVHVALDKARPLNVGVERVRVRIITEPIHDSVDPPSEIARIGPVQVHHVHFKCTVYFTEIVHVGGPAPKTIVDEDCQEVIYIDHDHLHRVGKPEATAAEAKTVR